MVKVNLGSGPIGTPDWINLDWGILPILSKLPWLTYVLVKLRLLPVEYQKPWPSNPRLHDCRKRLPFTDQSVDYIYTSHFLEHLHRYQALELLKECKRVLKRKGILRIAVPDLEVLTKKYLENF